MQMRSAVSPLVMCLPLAIPGRVMRARVEVVKQFSRTSCAAVLQLSLQLLRALAQIKTSMKGVRERRANHVLHVVKPVASQLMQKTAFARVLGTVSTEEKPPRYNTIDYTLVATLVEQYISRPIELFGKQGLTIHLARVHNILN